MKNEVLQILNNSDGTISEELKIKAIAAALYVGISNLPVDTYLNFWLLIKLVGMALSAIAN